MSTKDEQLVEVHESETRININGEEIVIHNVTSREVSMSRQSSIPDGSSTTNTTGSSEEGQKEMAYTCKKCPGMVFREEELEDHRKQFHARKRPRREEPEERRSSPRRPGPKSRTRGPLTTATESLFSEIVSEEGAQQPDADDVSPVARLARAKNRHWNKTKEFKKSYKKPNGG